MKLGIDPKIDFAFKRMCQEKSVLKSIVQSVVDFEISDLEIVSPFLDKVSPNDKYAVLDIRAQDVAGRQFNIEIQLSIYPELLKRFVYYWARIYSSQLNEGDFYDVLRPTISICFINGTIFRHSPNYVHCLQLKDRGVEKVVFDDLQIHVLELTKFRKQIEELQTPLDRWLYFLLYAEDFDPQHLPDRMVAPEIETAVRKLKMISDSEVEQALYEARQKQLRDTIGVQKYAKRMEEEFRQAEEKLHQAEEKLRQTEERVRQNEERARQAEEQLQQAGKLAHQIELSRDQAITEMKQKTKLIAQINMIQSQRQLAESSTDELFEYSLEKLKQLLMELSR